MAKGQKPSKAKIRKQIIDFLNATSGQVDKRPGKYSCGMVHKTSLVLATSYNDRPRATPLEFFNEGLTLYIFGEPGGKIANIKRNPHVSAAIYEQPLDHSKVQRSLQIFGKAELISVRNNPRLFHAKARKWNLYGVAERLFSPVIRGKKISNAETTKTIAKLLSSLNLIKIIPEHIILREYHQDFSMPKYEWKK